jgi:uncharacterized phiE125 gp8 family phage protein
VIDKTDLETRTDPSEEPVSLAEMKEHLRVDYATDDDLITAQIQAAREWIEERYNLSLGIRNYVAHLPLLPARIEFPYQPLIALDTIQYWDTNSPSTLTTLFDATSSPEVENRHYWVKESAGFAWFKTGQSIPSVACRPDAVEVSFRCGKTATPAPIVAAIKLLVGGMYENRESTSKLQVRELPTCKNLLAPYRVIQ